MSKTEEMNEETKEKKTGKKKRRTSPVTVIILIACIGIFCYAGYRLFSIYWEYGKAEAEYEDLVETYQLPLDTEDTTSATTDKKKKDTEELDPLGWPRYAVDIDTLQQLNSDIIGWIYMPGSVVNYPIVRAEDNNYYLRRTIRGTYNTAGSIFMDCANQPDFTDLNTILYGHNMKNGSMFGSFKNFYQDEDYYKEHPYFYIYTPDKKWNKYEIFSGYHCQSDDSSYDYVKENAYEKYVERALSRSIIDFGVEVDTENKKTVVTLSTCSGRSGGTQRFLLHGVWIDEKITQQP